MTSSEIRELFIEYFKRRGHMVIPSASLVPENDPSALFTSAGMQPLVPNLMGEPHPLGQRLVDAQKCIRTDDIDEVGDKVHHTFFEMLGNWSLGDPEKPDGVGAGYFKSEAIEWSLEFLTDKKWLGLEREKLAISVFAGDDDVPFDEESYNKWLELGIKPDRIAKLPKKNNWWGPGDSGPCGPDTEMFYWTATSPAPDRFDNKDENWVEIWNDVFIQFLLKEGHFTPLTQKNVDTGMGLERMTAVLNNLDDNYKTDLFSPIIEKITQISGKDYEGNKKEFRIIADHLKAAVFAISDGVSPSNKGAGYVVRRLIRRAIVQANRLGIKENFSSQLAEVVCNIYTKIYDIKKDQVTSELEKEETKFKRTLQEGLKVIAGQREASGKLLFDLYQSFGLPFEVSAEEFKRYGIEINNKIIDQYNNLLKEHKELSRTASAGMFKGGLSDSGEESIKYHTATHLLLAALQKVVDPNIIQRGSNITAERLRFDFNYAEKLTPEQLEEVESLVNEQISRNLPVTMEEMSLSDAKKSDAKGIFDLKYGDKVKVYTIGPSTLLGVNSNDRPSTPSGRSGSPFSREICGGPHVKNTGELGKFKIVKEESSSAGVRRIKAILQN